jgi:hypothetical protein
MRQAAMTAGTTWLNIFFMAILSLGRGDKTRLPRAGYNSLFRGLELEEGVAQPRAEAKSIKKSPGHAPAGGDLAFGKSVEHLGRSRFVRPIIKFSAKKISERIGNEQEQANGCE